jgi:prepilin-type N-terminal cleavage/methylation domain-containing protein
MKAQQSTRREAQAGFSLIELVVGVAIFAVVATAVYGLLEVGRADAFSSTQRVGMLQNVRVAMESVGRDAINAGIGFPRDGATIPDNKLTVFGLPADADNEFDRVTPVIAGDGVNSNTLNPTPNTKTDQITFVFQDDTFNNGEPVGLTNINGGQQLRLDKAVSAPAICYQGDLYIVWGASSALAMATQVPGGTNNAVDCANSDPLGINQPGANGPLGKLGNTATTLYRVAIVSYLVTPDGTLVRRVWGSPTRLAGDGVTVASPTQGYFDEPLAFGVEDFQIRYVLAPDGVAVTNPTTAQRANIRQVQVTITTRSTEKDRQGMHQRTTLTSTFSTRNLVYSKQQGSTN